MSSVCLSEQFKSLRDNLKNVVAALENDTPQGTVLVTEADQWKQYWSTFESYASSLNQSCHILAISFRSLPLPSTSDTADIVARLQGSAVGVLQALVSLGPGQGPSFIKQIRTAGVEVVGSALTFVEEAFVKNGYPVTHDGLLLDKVLPLVGIVGEKCKSLSKLPRTPTLLIHSQLQSHLQMVDDALRELEEAKNQNNGGAGDCMEGDDFDVTYSEEDLKLLMPALGLFKTVKALIKKVSQTVKKYGDSSTPENVKELEDLAEICSRISPSVDEYSEVLYPPISAEEVRSKSSALIQLSNDIHEMLLGKHYARDDEVTQWREFLLKALNHNKTQVEIALTADGLSRIAV